MEKTRPRANVVSVGYQRARLIPGAGPRIPLAALPHEWDPDREDHKLFTVPFGRDSLIMADDFDDDREVAEDTMVHLATWQGEADQTCADEEGLWSEEELGRILHEHRRADDPIALRLARTRFWRVTPYYGAVDSTPLFVRLVAKHNRQYGPDFLSRRVDGHKGTARTLAASLVNSVQWIKRRMDRNVQGFIESQSPNPMGIQFQSWRDGRDSYFRQDGTRANAPVASTEVQGLAYDALLSAAELYGQMAEMSEWRVRDMVGPCGISSPADLKKEASELVMRAQALKSSVISNLYVAGSSGGPGYFALGSERTNGTFSALAVKSSVMGWLLNTRLFEGSGDERYTREIVTHLFSEDMFVRWGVRTLADSELRFCPLSYHNGSIWQMDNNQMAKGLWQRGYYNLAWQLYWRNILITNRLGTFPEFIQGYDSTEPLINTVKGLTFSRGGHPVEYQEPQPVQGWSVSAVWQAKKMMRELRRRKVPLYALDPAKAAFEQSVLKNIPSRIIYEQGRIPF